MSSIRIKDAWWECLEHVELGGMDIVVGIACLRVANRQRGRVVNPAGAPLRSDAIKRLAHASGVETRRALLRLIAVGTMAEDGETLFFPEFSKWVDTDDAIRMRELRAQKAEQKRKAQQVLFGKCSKPTTAQKEKENSLPPIPPLVEKEKNMSPPRWPESEWIKELWNKKTAKRLPKVMSMTRGRSSAFHHCRKMEGLNTAERWVLLLDRVLGSSFLTGQRGDDAWLCNLDWLIKKPRLGDYGDNAVKVLEGNYDDKPGRNFDPSTRRLS